MRVRVSAVLILSAVLFAAAGEPTRADAHSDEDACPQQLLPKEIKFRTAHATFNSHFDYALVDGHICFRPNTPQPGEWQKLFTHSGVDGQVDQISADSDDLIAIARDRQIYTMKGALTGPGHFVWTSKWGAPLWEGSGMKLPADTLSWDVSYDSADEDHDYTDAAGNTHWVGGGCTTLYALRGDHQRITYLDPWLPSDESYEVCGPVHGHFKMASLTTTGSTIFVIGERGDMFTRVYDFDISGADWVFFPYSWNNQKGHTHTLLRQLPAPDWRPQPKIDGIITDKISMSKFGRDGVHRILRVEGLGEGGTGYWEKDIDPTLPWTFHATGLPLEGQVLSLNSTRDTSGEDLGPADDHAYDGTLDMGGGQAWNMKLENFNAYCSPGDLTVDFGGGDLLKLKLHTTQSIRQTKRERGLSGNPLELRAAIEVPDGAHSAKAQWFIRQFLGRDRFTSVSVSVSVSATLGEVTISDWVRFPVRLKGRAGI